MQVEQFCFVQDLYESVQDFLKFSGSDRAIPDRSCVKAATDDCIVILRAEPGKREQFYKRVDSVVKMMRTGGESLGLTFVNKKSQILLPKGWDSEFDVVAEVDTRSELYTDKDLQGMIVVGAPIGSLAFRRSLRSKTFSRCCSAEMIFFSSIHSVR